MKNKENNNNDMLIKQNLFLINRNLIMNKQTFNDWDGYQQFFKESLNAGVLRRKDVLRFAWNLYYSPVICKTQIEDEELKKEKSGIINFLKKLYNYDYTQKHNINSENIGALYEQELAKATTPEVKKNNTSYTKRSSSR